MNIVQAFMLLPGEKFQWRAFKEAETRFFICTRHGEADDDNVYAKEIINGVERHEDKFNPYAKVEVGE